MFLYDFFRYLFHVLEISLLWFCWALNSISSLLFWQFTANCLPSTCFSSPATEFHLSAGLFSLSLTCGQRTALLCAGSCLFTPSAMCIWCLSPVGTLGFCCLFFGVSHSIVYERNEALCGVWYCGWFCHIAESSVDEVVVFSCNTYLYICLVMCSSCAAL